jgi:2'-5' RNA ligase
MTEFDKALDLLTETLLLERENVSKGCAMIFFKPSVLKQLQDKIEEDDLYIKDGDFGLETEPHVTLLYGFINDPDPKDIINHIEEYDIPEHLSLDGISLFENEYDVLKIDMKKEGFLTDVNKSLRKDFEYENDYDDFHPHCTIAYIKKGKGKKYVDMFKDFEQSDFEVEKIVYSDADMKKTTSFGL